MVKTLKVVWRIKNSLFDELVGPKKDSSFCIKELFTIIWEAMWKKKGALFANRRKLSKQGQWNRGKKSKLCEQLCERDIYIYIYIERERERERERVLVIEWDKSSSLGGTALV